MAQNICRGPSSFLSESNCMHRIYRYRCSVLLDIIFHIHWRSYGGGVYGANLLFYRGSVVGICAKSSRNLPWVGVGGGGGSRCMAYVNVSNFPTYFLLVDFSLENIAPLKFRHPGCAADFTCGALYKLAITVQSIVVLETKSCIVFSESSRILCTS